jgi:chitinase
MSSLNTYTTYVTTWGTDPLVQIQDMINKLVIQNNTRIVLAFASFNFVGSDYIPGFGNISMEEVQQITNLVHSNNGKISLSVGGATYPFANSDLYSNPGDLANNINQILLKCGFDGVDFDVEDYYGNVPSDFVNQCASLINTLRSLNNGLYITLTTPAQAWAQGCYQQQLINLTIGNINAWQPMEYDLWIQSGSTYYNQILYDINFYINNWYISPKKIILGLMPGNDDMNRDLTLQDALNLTTFAQSLNLQGVMTWDANIDSTGPDGNAPYAYSLGIQSILYKEKYKKSNIMFNHYNKKNYKKCNLYKLSKKI